MMDQHNNLKRSLDGAEGVLEGAPSPSGSYSQEGATRSVVIMTPFLRFRRPELKKKGFGVIFLLYVSMCSCMCPCGDSNRGTAAVSKVNTKSTEKLLLMAPVF